jgi:hypothetical protein
MLSIAEADALVERHLGGTPRAAHSRFIGHLMRCLAEILEANADLWEVVGLCHDLDFLETSTDPSRHGLLTIEWLAGSLPEVARQAIAAHDHRTGVQAETQLADMLKVADAVAVIDHSLGRGALCAVNAADAYPALRSRLGDRSFLCDIVQRRANKHHLSFARIVACVSVLPPQPTS